MSTLVEKLEKLAEIWDRVALGRTCFRCGKEPCERGPIPTAVECDQWRPIGTIFVEKEEPHEDSDKVLRKV